MAVPFHTCIMHVRAHELHIQVHVHRVQTCKKGFLPVGSQPRVGRKCDYDVDNSAHAQGDVRSQGIDETSAAETNKLS